MLQRCDARTARSFRYNSSTDYHLTRLILAWSVSSSLLRTAVMGRVEPHISYHILVSQVTANARWAPPPFKTRCIFVLFAVTSETHDLRVTRTRLVAICIMPPLTFPGSGRRGIHCSEQFGFFRGSLCFAAYRFMDAVWGVSRRGILCVESIVDRVKREYVRVAFIA